MKPSWTVSTQTFSRVCANRATSGGAVELGTVFEAVGPGEDRRDRVGRGVAALLVLAETAGDGAVRRLGLDGLALGRHQPRGHPAERVVNTGAGELGSGSGREREWQAV